MLSWWLRLVLRVILGQIFSTCDLWTDGPLIQQRYTVASLKRHDMNQLFLKTAVVSGWWRWTNYLNNVGTHKNQRWKCWKVALFQFQVVWSYRLVFFYLKPFPNLHHRHLMSFQKSLLCPFFFWCEKDSWWNPPCRHRPCACRPTRIPCYDMIARCRLAAAVLPGIFRWEIFMGI